MARLTISKSSALQWNGGIWIGGSYWSPRWTVSESLLHIRNPLTLRSHLPLTLHAKAGDYFYLKDTEQSISKDTAVIEMTSKSLETSIWPSSFSISTWRPIRRKRRRSIRNEWIQPIILPRKKGNLLRPRTTHHQVMPRLWKLSGNNGEIDNQ